ncbi:MAG: hypothetical protein R2707_06555 [Acidimicrobiales bacterium]
MKRVFWSTVGYAAGLGTSVYVQRRVRRAVEYYTPEQVRRDVAVLGRQAADRARDVVIDLREAAAEGAEAMREREAELRREYAPGVPGEAGTVARPHRRPTRPRKA